MITEKREQVVHASETNPQRERRGRATLVFPLLLYSLVAVLFFGRGLFGHMTTFHIGEGADPPLLMWYLVWWPHAIANGLNPFLTGAYWAPYGFNIAWSTCIPLISLVATPVTEALGPVASLNILCLLSLPLAAWCAFILCDYLCKNYWVAILGGYIFGFCPSLLGQLIFGRLHSVMIFPLPLAVYLAVRRFRGEIASRSFTLLLAVLLAIQFFFSAETFATMTLFGGIMLLLGWLETSGEVRRSFFDLGLAAACSYVIVLVAVSPFLYFMFFSARPYDSAIWSNKMLSADLLNFLIPAPINELGRIPWIDAISAPFNVGVPAEQGAYLSLPLIVIAAFYARRHWRDTLGRLLVDLLIITVVLSLGEKLVVHGEQTPVFLPWKVLEVSVLKNAAPSRFSTYAFLILAIMTSLWITAVTIRPYLKVAIAALIVICLLPNLSSQFWIQSAKEPAFFRDGLYRNYLSKDEIVLILPFWSRNESMIWQADAQMYFRIAQGPGPWPAEFKNWPILDAFFRESYMPEGPEQFKAYLLAHQVRALIIADDSLPVWQQVASTLGITPIRVGGVSLYQLPAPDPKTVPTITEMRTRYDNERWVTLLTGIHKYLSHGGNLSDLHASNLVAFGVIPASSLLGPAEAPPEVRHPEVNWHGIQEFSYGVGLMVAQKNLIALAMPSWYPVAKDIIEKYRSTATRSFFFLPGAQLGVTKPDTMGTILMFFTRQQIAAAAAIAQASMASGRDNPPAASVDHSTTAAVAVQPR